MLPSCNQFLLCVFFRSVAVGSNASSAPTSASETLSTSSTASQSRSAFAAMAIAQARAAGQMGHTAEPQTASSLDHYSTAEVFKKYFQWTGFNGWDSISRPVQTLKKASCLL
jgi:hypothetical protein